MKMSLSSLIPILLLALVSFSSALPADCSETPRTCTADWQCSSSSPNSITNDYNFIKCVSGVCKCRSELGIVGSALPSDKCRCPSPKTVTWQSGKPYCLAFDECAVEDQAEQKVELQKYKIRTLYEYLIAPTPMAILTGQLSLDDIFASNARGRIDPVGVFEDSHSLIEYYFGLSASPDSYVIDVDLVDLFGVGDEVFVRVNILFQYANPAYGQFNLTQSGRYTFNNQSLIQSTDLIIHNLGQVFDPSVQFDQAGTIAKVCGLLTVTPGVCPLDVDPEGFANFNECYEFMSSIKFGTFYNLRENSVVCRFLHAILSIYNPIYHCPHTNSAGGLPGHLKCVDKSISDYYSSTY